MEKEEDAAGCRALLMTTNGSQHQYSLELLATLTRRRGYLLQFPHKLISVSGYICSELGVTPGTLLGSSLVFKLLTRGNESHGGLGV